MDSLLTVDFYQRNKVVYELVSKSMNVDPDQTIKDIHSMLDSFGTRYVPDLDMSRVILFAKSTEAISKVIKEWPGYTDFVFQRNWNLLSPVHQRSFFAAKSEPIPSPMDEDIINALGSKVDVRDFLLAPTLDLSQITDDIALVLLDNVPRWPRTMIEDILKATNDIIDREKTYITVATLLLQHFALDDVKTYVTGLIMAAGKLDPEQHFRLFRAAIDNNIDSQMCLQFLIKSKLDPSSNDNQMVYLLAQRGGGEILDIILECNPRVGLPQRATTVSKIVQNLYNISSPNNTAVDVLKGLLNHYVVPAKGVAVILDARNDKHGAIRSTILRDVRIEINAMFAKERVDSIRNEGLTLKDAIEQLQWGSKAFSTYSRGPLNELTKAITTNANFLRLVDMDKQSLVDNLNDTFNEKGVRMTRLQAILLLCRKMDRKDDLILALSELYVPTIYWTATR